MDHIQYPISNLTRPRISIPYVCTPRFTYDDKGFCSYPLRAGVDFNLICARDEIASPSFAPFLQAWLWFGLLGETLDIRSQTHVPLVVISFQSFIKTTEGGRNILTTEALRDAVKKRREETVPQLTNNMLLREFDQALSVATKALNAVLQTPSSRKHVTTVSSVKDLDEFHVILLSIQILLESLRSYRGYLFSVSAHHALPRIHNLDLCRDLIDILLREAGWCQSQIRRIDADLQIQYFLSSTFKHERCADATCQDKRCGAPIWKKTMDPVHTHPTCMCDSVELSDTIITSISQKQKVPLVTFGEVSSGERLLDIKELDIISPTSKVPFVAFSHVRNKGLGNTSGHGLPRCQLALLQEIANDTLDSSPRPVPFYIDTMCVPLQGDAKKESLKKLSWVYSDASIVVVLDPSLTSVAVGSDIDCLLRIRYSAWKTRLWTLQEGSLAKILVFRFANRTCDLDDVLRRFSSEAPLSIFNRSLETSQPYLDSGLLLARVRAFDRDTKVPKDLNDVAGPDTKTSLRSVLRLGYLGLSRYRFFRGEEENAQCLLVLQALEELYFEPSSSRDDSQVRVFDRLRHMYSLSRSRRISF